MKSNFTNPSNGMKIDREIKFKFPSVGYLSLTYNNNVENIDFVFITNLSKIHLRKMSVSLFCDTIRRYRAKHWLILTDQETIVVR